ncbi:MAG: DUF5076 domain-containing protein [Sphingomonas sp.]|uniref:DUF5076 domain-containing protein n=1 Tax=Sphingomonas sp. TaxID=28214 RepID=UPI003F80599B
MTDKPIPIDLVPFADVLGGGREFLRAWTKGDNTLSFVNPRPIGPDPAMFGLALVDIARDAAASYAKAIGIAEQEALERIWKGMDLERGAAPDDNALPPPVVVARKDD